MTSLPLLPVSMVGSWPRPPALLRAQKAHRLGRLSDEEFEKLCDAAVLEVLRRQEEAGLDLVTDGEQRRDNFYSFVAGKLQGVKLMSLHEMLDIVEDKESFEEILKTLEVPAYSLSNPTCVGRIERREPLAVEELRFLCRHTQRAIKVPLPGPYLLTRAMFVKEVTQDVYAGKEELGEDVVRVLREEIEDLLAEGAELIQLDEPVLTEVVFTQGRTRTFMCASLAAGGDPAEELRFARGLLNAVLEGFPGDRFGMHVCRGNWSQNESILLSGGYHPLQETLEQVAVGQLVLEYATHRAGDLLRFEGKRLGLGVVNPRTERVEEVAEIEEAVRRALELYRPEELSLNPDCGFGTFSNSPVNSSDVAYRKLCRIVETARKLRRDLD